MGYVAGHQKYLNLAAETSWGETPGSPTYFQIPYLTYDVSAKPQSRQAQLFTGSYQRRHNKVFRTALDGNLVVQALGYHVSSQSIFQRLMTWAIDRTDTLFLPSMLAEIGDNGVDNKRHNGLRVNTLAIAGSADSGEITMSLGLIGCLETGGISLQARDETIPQPTDFNFADSSFLIGGSTVKLRSFAINITNNLQPKWNNTQYPDLISAGMREITYQFQLVKTANTYDALRRSIANNNYTGQLVLKGLHGGTASNNYTTVQIDFDRLNFMNSPADIGGLNDLMEQSVDSIVLKPDTTDNEMDITYGTAS